MSNTSPAKPRSWRSRSPGSMRIWNDCALRCWAPASSTRGTPPRRSSAARCHRRLQPPCDRGQVDVLGGADLQHPVSLAGALELLARVRERLRWREEVDADLVLE